MSSHIPRIRGRWTQDWGEHAEKAASVTNAQCMKADEQCACAHRPNVVCCGRFGGSHKQTEVAKIDQRQVRFMVFEVCESRLGLVSFITVAVERKRERKR